MDKKALFKAVEIAGGQTALARAIGVPQNTLWYWLHRNKSMPIKHIPAIEAATGISRDEFLPGFFAPAPTTPTTPPQPVNEEAVA